MKGMNGEHLLIAIIVALVLWALCLAYSYKKERKELNELLGGKNEKEKEKETNTKQSKEDI